MKKAFLILIIFVINYSCTVNSDPQTNNENDLVVFKSTSFKVTRITESSDSYQEFMSLLNQSKNKSESRNIISSFDKDEIYKTIDFDNNLVILTQKVEEFNEKINGFEQISNIVKSTNLNNNFTTIYIHRISSKESITIEELINPINGNVIAYNLKNIDDLYYREITNNIENRTICYKNFRTCYNRLEAAIAADPEDSAICDWLPCSTINYGACKILEGSGYMQDSGNFVGNSNCDVIYRNNKYVNYEK